MERKKKVLVMGVIGADVHAVEAGSDTLENEPKIVHDASGRFSLTEAGQTKTPEDTDVVNFIVVMKEQSLLAAGFSTDDIAARTASVTRYEAEQTASLDSLKTQMTKRFASDENFEIGFTYTVATTGVSCVISAIGPCFNSPDAYASEWM